LLPEAGMKPLNCYECSLKFGETPFALCLLFALALPAFAVGGRTQVPTDVVKIREGALSVDHARQGSTFEVAVVLEIKYEVGDHYEWIAPFHINSNQPLDALLVPTKLELEEIKGFTIGPIRYPTGREVKLGFSDHPLSVYSAVPSNPVMIRFKVEVAPDLPLDLYYLKAKLTYQPCGDKGCGAVQTLNVRIPVSIVSAKTKVHRINREYFGARARDYALIPLRIPRAVKEIGRCMVRGCS
jgi:hypothetical protein